MNYITWVAFFYIICLTCIVVGRTFLAMFGTRKDSAESMWFFMGMASMILAGLALNVLGG